MAQGKPLAKTTYFICFGTRTGSTLLCELLTSTGLAGQPGEHFLHNIGPHNPMGDDIPDYKAHVQRNIANNTTPNGVYGAKISGAIWHDFMRRLHSIDGYAETPLPDILNDLFPNLHYIWLTRRNKVRQAVSHWMAIQSGRWHSSIDALNPEPEYLFEAIDHLVQENVIQDALWGDYFAANDIAPLVLVYEDFIHDFEGTVRRVLDYIGVPMPDEMSIPQPKLKQLADVRTEAWVQRYRREKQAGWWAQFW